MAVGAFAIKLAAKGFQSDANAQVWRTNCEYELRCSICFWRWAMLGELVNIPTDTLIDMLYVILAGEFGITASEAAEIEQLQCELQRRGDAPIWSFGTVN
jgi:hypothetical protein